ncbi:MAG: phosphoribosyltransferase [Gammaproteobacteria bacterium]|jgi:predicted phosphoribosyltransferase|nr:phosphoribosyltransferase [Gammaproteobacteria bacterium]
MNRYANRYSAGKVLAKELDPYRNRLDIIVLALPRGGVPVAFEIAKTLSLALDIFIVRKLGVSGHEELAMGAIAIGNITVFNQDIIQNLAISKQAINEAINRESKELQRREFIYRGKRPFPTLTEKTIILVDDGIATGATLRAAITALRQLKVLKIIVAVPVAEKTTCRKITTLVDKLICPIQSENFYAVGQYYDDFSQTTDEEVCSLLKLSRCF